jgi:hypothetical protein
MKSPPGKTLPPACDRRQPKRPNTRSIQPTLPHNSLSRPCDRRGHPTAPACHPHLINYVGGSNTHPNTCTTNTRSPHQPPQPSPTQPYHTHETTRRHESKTPAKPYHPTTTRTHVRNLNLNHTFTPNPQPQPQVEVHPQPQLEVEGQRFDRLNMGGLLCGVLRGWGGLGCVPRGTLGGLLFGGLCGRVAACGVVWGCGCRGVCRGALGGLVGRLAGLGISGSVGGEVLVSGFGGLVEGGCSAEWGGGCDGLAVSVGYLCGESRVSELFHAAQYLFC